MSGKITGYNETSVKNLTTGAAVLYKDFDMETDTVESAKTKIIGATSGGVTIKIEADSWYREIDGVPENTKGMYEVEGYKPTFETTLAEMGESQFLLAIGAADATTKTEITGRKIITPRHEIKDADHCENITAITQTKEGEPLIIQILNPLSTEGFEFATEFKAGGGLAVTFTGFYDPAKMSEPPIKIYTPTPTV